MHGIVIIGIYSNNKKVNTLYTPVASHFVYNLTVLRLGNPKMSVVYCSTHI